MRDFIFNSHRTKKFYLDQIIYLEKLDLDHGKAMMLHFADGTDFIVTDNEESFEKIAEDYKFAYENIYKNPFLNGNHSCDFINYNKFINAFEGK